MSKKPEGHKCSFIVNPPEHLHCWDCKCVAREPTITVCCGRTFCQECIERVRGKGDPCPFCGKEVGEPVPQLWYREAIDNLSVECSKKDKGCDWKGVLKDLDTHLDETKGTCMFIEVFCPRGCGEKLERKYTEPHLNNDCIERDFSCHYCNKRGSYRDITTEHWMECACKPVKCPNQCGNGEFICEQSLLEEHLNTCPLSMVQCPYHSAGCTAKFQRIEEEDHLERNAQQHLSLAMKMCQKLKVELEAIESKYERGLQEQAQRYAQRLQTLEKQQADAFRLHEEKFNVMHQEYEHKIKTMKYNFEMVLHGKDESMKLVKEKMDSKIDSRVKEQLESFKQMAGILPYNFTMTGFHKLKQDNELWYSPKMITHNQGYTFLISVRANGYGDSKDNSVGVWLRSVKGQHDNDLRWPAKVTISLQLLNQHRNQDHLTIRKLFHFVQATDSCNVYIDEFSPNFILHRELGYNTAKQTQYLKDDCLKFRVTTITLR